MHPKKEKPIVLVALTGLAFGGAYALAQPGNSTGYGPGSSIAHTPGSTPDAGVPAARATHAAAALADAHPGDRAVAYLADIARREITRAAALPDQSQAQVLNSFSQSAEEHKDSQYAKCFS